MEVLKQEWNNIRDSIGFSLKQLDPEFYDLSGKGVLVGIIDSGYTSGNKFFNTDNHKRFLDLDHTSSGSCNDDLGHGSQVAGIISASFSISPNANFFNRKIYGYNTSDPFNNLEQALSTIIEEMRVPADNYQKPDILNLSISDRKNYVNEEECRRRYSEIIDLLTELDHKGVIITCSSGNSYADAGREGMSFPAICDAVISVGGYDQRSSSQKKILPKCQVSMSGRRKTDIVAPGFHIPTVDTGNDINIIPMSGSSAACAVVTSAICLLKEYYNNNCRKEDNRFDKNLLLKTMREQNSMNKTNFYNNSINILNLSETLLKLKRMIKPKN